MMNDGWKLRDELIWLKQNPFPIKPLYRFKDGFERLFHFTKGDNFKWNPESVKVDSKPDTCARIQRGINQKKTSNNSPFASRYKRNYDRLTSDKFDCSKAYPRNIIEAPVGVGRTKHPARFPSKIPNFFIKLLSNEGDVVLDPFMGSGTVGVEAKKLCRKSIGIDIMPEYVSMANTAMDNVKCKVDD